MKRIIGIIAVVSLFLTTGFTAYATSPIFSAHTYLSAQSLQEREAELRIETKDDKEVFSISGNEKFFAFEYADESADLIFEVTSSNKSLESEIFLSKAKAGFKVNAKIENETEVDSMCLSINMPAAWRVGYAKNNRDKENGSLGVYNEAGTPVASTGLATAIDAAGNEVEAKLRVKNDAIFVSVSGDNISYPIDVSFGVYAANALRGVTDYFHYAGFNLVYTGSLTLGPRYFDEGSVIECTNAWNAVYNLFYPYSPYWTNSTQTQSMNDQYWCHANFAKNKPQWNLEPWRPVVSWSTMILNRCNPE